MKILVSACLLGEPCRYDGQGKPNGTIQALGKEHVLIPFCPETAGGLPVPREPAELQNGSVLTRDGRDVTVEFLNGARKTLECFRNNACDCAILKERSPSCGSRWIYDGTFTGTVIRGEGTACRMLRQSGFPVCSEETLDQLQGMEKNAGRPASGSMQLAAGIENKGMD